MQLSRVEISGRRWYKGSDGKLYPSAGSVLDILFPNSRDWISEDALARGSACHEAMARMLLTTISTEAITTIDLSGYDEEVLMRCKSVMAYLVKFHYEIMAIESPTLFLGIGMTPDFVAREAHPNGGWIKHLYDWKFAEDITEQYLFQAELYGRAEEAGKVTILQCNRKGEIFPQRVRPNEERWELIKSAINVRNHIDKGVKRYV